MDLSSALSAMSTPGAGASAGVGGSTGAGMVGNSTVACPVCTLYLREGISLQKHLDTHPKEQVIEALIRASGAGGMGVQQPMPPSPAVAPMTVPIVTPTVSQQQQPQQHHQASVGSSGSHIPTAQSPYPIGPIYECPPINAVIPPPQFASFSYQQFVNNGTMMIPTQYAMAQPQPPQANQMMQMLYSPYGMYHQQQIPTMQMISAPPPIMPTTAPTLPTTLPATHVTAHIRPAPSSVAPLPSASEPTTTTTTTTTTTSSPPKPQVECTAQSTPSASPTEQQQQPVRQPSPPPEPQPQLLVSTPKIEVIAKLIPGPDRILPDLEMPESPEQIDLEPDNEESSVDQHTENTCLQEVQQQEQLRSPHTNEQYQRENPPTIVGPLCDDGVDDEKTESILPDIEDNAEIESLLVRGTDRVTIDKDSAMETEECVERMDTSISEEPKDEEIVETIQCNEVDSCKESDNKPEDEDGPKIIEETVVPSTSSISRPRILSIIRKPEIEHLSQLLFKLDSEISKVEEPSRCNLEVEIIEKRNQENIQNVQSEENQEKLPEEDESAGVLYDKNKSDPFECKIIVAHDESDVSSVVSSDSIECETEMKKVPIMYQYKYSQSAPTSPACTRKSFPRSLSRASLRSNFDPSRENISSYPIGFEATTLHDFLKDNYNDEDMELEEPEHFSFMKQNSSAIVERTSLPRTPISNASVLKARHGKTPTSARSVRSSLSFCQLEDDEEEDEEDEEEEDEEDTDADSCISLHSDEKDVEDQDEEDIQIMRDDKSELRENKNELISPDSKIATAAEIIQKQEQEPANFRSQSLMADHYASSHFSPAHHSPSRHHQHQSSATSIHQGSYPLSNSEISQNLLNMSECVDPTTSTDSKSYSNSCKSTMQKPSTELLNINENAHAGPMNVFEFDGLQILVPSTFISESSQKAVSATSQQSMSSSENGVGNDEEVKSVNMRADETMPPRGELSEQESNGCTEHSAWQVIHL